MWLKRLVPRALGILASAILIASMIQAVFPALPTQADGIGKTVELSYPTLKTGVQYYQTTFPSGLKYSPGWYGTFTHAPPASEILLFDDDWTTEWGRCIFSMPLGIVPTGVQGGTSLKAITKTEADSIIKSYPLKVAFEPFDAEIEAVMQADHFFTGVWAGEKLNQKWEYGSAGARAPPSENLTDRQKEYIKATEGLDIKTVDLTKYDPNRYWVGNGGNWTDNATHWSDSSNGTAGASLPTSADSVFFDLNSFTLGGQTVTVDAAANCLDMDWTGATNTPTLAGSNALNIYGNLTFIAGMNIPYSGNINFKSTAIGKTVTVAQTLVCAVYFNGVGGGWTLQDDVNNLGGFFVIVAGTLDTAGKTITTSVFSDTGTAARVLTLGASVINCASWSFGTTAGATLTANTATINVAGTGVFAGASLTTYNNINLNGAAHTVSGAFTCANLARYGTATKTDTVTFTSGTTVTVTENCTLSGNSTTNRLLVQSSTLGTAATINTTAWAGTQNVDFMDITSTNAVDLSAITGLSGDCGGNTNITFTASAAQTVASAGNFSGAIWGAGRMPLPQDDWSCLYNLTIDEPRIGRSITFIGTPTISHTIDLDFYGSFIFASGVTYSGGTTSLNSRGRGSFTFTSNGKTLYNLVVRNVGGTLTLQDALICGNQLAIRNGGFNSGNQTIAALTMNGWVSGTTTNIVLGSSIITLSNVAVVAKVSFTASDVVSAGTSTIILTNSTANAQTFAGGGKVYYNVTVTGAGNYALTISGSNNFTNLSVNATNAPKTIKFTDGTLQTVSDLTRDPGGTNIITFNGTAAAGWNIAKTDATDILLDYLTVVSSNATPANTFYAGTHSTNGGGNTGWTFNDAPLTVTTNPATGITMDKDGVTGGNFNATIGTLAGTPYISTQIEYGLTPLYGTLTPAVMKYAYGAYLVTVPVNLVPGQTYHYRASITNGAGTYTGADESFTYTLPSVTTVAESGVTMDRDGVTAGNYNTNITNMGVATSTYARINYGTTLLYGTNTADVTRLIAGAFPTAMLHNLIPGQNYHFRSQLRVGAVTVEGADEDFTFTMPSLSASAPTVSKVTENSYGFILNGNVSNMGVASSTYYGFSWGFNPAILTNVTPVGSTAAIGGQTADIGNFLPGQTVYYRFYILNDGVVVSSSIQSGVGTTTPTSSTVQLLPLFCMLIGIVTILRAMTKGELSGINGVVLILVIIIITVAIVTSTNSVISTP